MKYEIIKDCGELGIEFSNIESAGARVSRDFLRKLLKQIIKRSTKYYEETREHFFTYREKQLHSVICPSIADITSSYLIEHPLTRKPSGEEEYLGSVDYWISYRNYSFLMELKHTYFAYRNADNPRKSITRKFNRAIEQLKSIRVGECRALTTNKGLIKIALLAVVFYKGSKQRILKDDLEKLDFKNLFKKLVQRTHLEQLSNMRSLWVLNERLVELVEYSNGFEVYPAIAFFANISEMIE